MRASPADRARGALFPGCACFLLPEVSTALHAHHALQVAIGRRARLELRTHPDAAWRAVRGAVIGPDQPHALRSETDVVHLYLAPETRLGRRWRRDVPLALLDDAVADAALRAIDAPADAAPDEGAVLRALALALGVDSSGDAHAELPLDPRVAAVLELLQREAGRRLPLAELAGRVGLSSRRLTHLFGQQVGIPVRRYVQWLRVVEVVGALAAGAAQTDAALAAGFADAAHLSRAFQRLFGAPPGAFAAAYLSRGRIVQDRPTGGS